MEWELIYGDLKKINLVVLLVLSSIGYFILNNFQTLGIIAGGVTSIANFMALQHTLKKAFGSDFRKRKRKAAVFLNYYFRLLVLGLIIFFLLKYQLVHPVGLTIGLSTSVIAIFILGICMALRQKAGRHN